MFSACLATKHKETIEGVYLHVFNSFGSKNIELYLVTALGFSHVVILSLAKSISSKLSIISYWGLHAHCSLE
jgi:hypothetical protein